MKQIHVTKTQETLLLSIARASTSSQALVRRAEIVLAGNKSSNQLAIAQDMAIQRNTVHLWLWRWQGAYSTLGQLETAYAARQLTEAVYQRAIVNVLADAPRPGIPPTITEEQKSRIIALATDKPENADIPITHWTCSTLRDAVIDKGIVPTISRSHIHRFLKQCHTTTTQK